MQHENILTALADPTRRKVLDRLRDGPTPVGRIADGLPVTRPAVSQHLKVLLEAGLVSMKRHGTRNLYALVPGGAAPLSDWLGALHPAAPAGGLTVATRLTQPEAWHLFCDDIALWWPVSQVSISARESGALPQAVTLEARPGGTLGEVLYDGRAGLWAEVVEAQAPGHLVLDWTLDEPGRVTVSITAEDGGSRLRLDGGEPALWSNVLDRFAAAANASLTNF